MESHKKPKVIVIVGPTASGKTALSLMLAKQLKGEVINADSRQVYKRLDVGTEKITYEEMEGIPHHLLSIVDINTVYTAMDFKKDAETAITEITERGNIPIIAGGTFFYIDTLLGKMGTSPVEPNWELREELEKYSTEELFTLLQKKDPRRGDTIEKDNKRRLIRALEIVDKLQSVPAQNPNAECPYDVLTIGISVEKEVLKERLRIRAQDALTRGLIEETQSLLACGVSKERLLEIGLQYKVVMEYIDGIITDTELIQKLGEKNWQYAKRQLLWLKRNEDIVWFKREDTDALSGVVSEFLKNYPKSIR